MNLLPLRTKKKRISFFLFINYQSKQKEGKRFWWMRALERQCLVLILQITRKSFIAFHNFLHKKKLKENFSIVPFIQLTFPVLSIFIWLWKKKFQTFPYFFFVVQFFFRTMTSFHFTVVFIYSRKKSFNYGWWEWEASTLLFLITYQCIWWQKFLHNNPITLIWQR